MITFSKIGEHGRLGNQLFQIAILKAISLKNSYQIILPNNLDEREWHGQKCLLKNFKLPSIKYGNIKIENKFFEKNGYQYDEEVFSTKDNTDFYGFFQNIKYYSNIQEELQKEFEIIDSIQNKINLILLKYKNETSVSLHVRRGDASDGTNAHDSNWSNDTSENSIMWNYYKNALKYIPKNSIIFIFSGGSRNGDNKNDIEWCKKNFKDERIVYLHDLNDIETFCFMKSCEININSFISTFGWWASFLNKNKNVIAPMNFHPGFNYYNLDDIYPSYWKLL